MHLRWSYYLRMHAVPSNNISNFRKKHSIQNCATTQAASKTAPQIFFNYFNKAASDFFLLLFLGRGLFCVLILLLSWILKQKYNMMKKLEKFVLISYINTQE